VDVYSSKEILPAYRAMLLSREVELYCTRLTPHWYPSIGEEATIVGTFSGLDAGDVAAPHYRGGLIVPWLRGRPLADVLACVHPSRESPTRGRLYGPFCGDVERRVVPYVTMVLGPTIAIAVGAALTFKLRAARNVAVASFGDGTAGTGDFHEALNLAAGRRLPVIFVAQNNQFSISTRASSALACDSIAEWARSYRMPAQRVDGNDVVAIADAVRSATARARDGGGPSFIEAQTYRLTGHFIADPAPYMDSREMEEQRRRDPLLVAEERLRAAGVREEVFETEREAAKAAVAQAAREAKARPPLTAGDLGL
jgi:acetoin:2,6-dichlorophenolindophenol oxidoreductase subunit alpha